MEVDRVAGPSRQRDGHLNPHVTVSDPIHKEPSVRKATIHAVPRNKYIHVEYPGIIPRDDSSSLPLHKALQTLSPHPPPYNNVGSALDHLGRLVTLRSKAIECRLGSFSDTPTFSEYSNQDQDTNKKSDIYRHAVVGDLVNTNDLVAVVKRRVWTRRKKKDKNDVTTFKEYTVEVLGQVETTARWRKLADFAFEPELNDDAEDQLVDVPQSSTGNAEEGVSRGGLLSLHDALAKMDVKSLRSFSVPEEKEDYEVEREAVTRGEKEKVMKSNLRAIPPPIFSRVDVPFPYGFRQPSTSSLESYQKPLPDGSTVEAQRWLNASRWKGLAPLQWSLTTNSEVPLNPPTEVSKLEPRCDPVVLNKLREIFDSRPVWTRTALINQLPDENMRKTVQFTKEYIPLVAYTIADGAWRDSLVKLGYDLRSSQDSRFYQKLSFQIPTSTGQKGKGSFKAAYGGAHSVGTAALTSKKNTTSNDGHAIDQDDETSASAERNERSGSPPPPPAPTVEPRNSHKFDGETLNRTTGTFTLCDIVDPVVQPYILAEGSDNILPFPTAETGWYTGEAFERIRVAVGVRYRYLFEHDGQAAPREDVWKAVENLLQRKAQRDRKERSQSQATTAFQDDVDMDVDRDH
ncbi:unnamed protein product [Sympodiomycopsis kandeliae]